MHKEKEIGFFEDIFKYLSSVSKSIFTISIYSTICSFLLGGAFASIMILARLYPEDLNAVISFVMLSELFARIALASLAIYLLSLFLSSIFKTKEVKQ